MSAKGNGGERSVTDNRIHEAEASAIIKRRGLAKLRILAAASASFRSPSCKGPSRTAKSGETYHEVCPVLTKGDRRTMATELKAEKKHAAAFARRAQQVKANWKDDMLTLPRPGHTKEASVFSEVHPGRETAAYYAGGVMAGALDAEEGRRMLVQLGRLQLNDPASPHFGGFRWYREETRINDTNAAFFIMSPLAQVALLFPSRIPASHRGLLQPMFAGARHWFARECREPILYYPNKIISDGALLLALAELTGDAEAFADGVTFFERWLDYTRRRGWGWGENMSLGYLGIIASSLQLAAYCLRERSRPLAIGLHEELAKLLELLRFHDGEELVPTIRSYNFQGEVRRPSVMWRLAGVAAADGPEHHNDLWMLTGEALFEQYTSGALALPEAAPQPVPRVRYERVMDDAHAYTWVGRQSRLGSLTRFPVLAGCYQWPTWGLGWQSFPVSFSVAGEQVGFLRWMVSESGALRAHPAESQPKAYLNPALFAESHYPDVETRCSQNGSALLAVRSLTAVNNRAAEIADEWLVPRFRQEAELHEIAGEDGVARTWAVLRYPGVTVAIAALDGIAADGTARAAAQLELLRAPDALRVRRVLYHGEERTVVHPRLESAWAVIVREAEPGGGAEGAAADAPPEREATAAWLRRVAVRDVSARDGETPRAPHEELRQLAVSGPSVPEVRLTVDPHARA